MISLGVEDVHRELLDRILTGFYPAGSRLPSCRSLARELNSNSSTVDRAIGRLARIGRVRTLPRRGTFVEQADRTEPDNRETITGQLHEVLLRARRLGFTADELDALIRAATERVDSVQRIGVVECNERDLRNLQQLVQRASGVEVQPVLLSEAAGRCLDDEFDAVAVPIFHLNEIEGLVRDMSKVVELTLVAAPSVLRRLVDVRRSGRLAVAAPSRRGVQWMTAMVGQYYPGEIEGFQIDSDDLAGLDGADVLVVNNATDLPRDIHDRVGEVIAVEWELDPRFKLALRERIETVINERALAVQA